MEQIHIKFREHIEQENGTFIGTLTELYHKQWSELPLENCKLIMLLWEEHKEISKHDYYDEHDETYQVIEIQDEHHFEHMKRFDQEKIYCEAFYTIKI